MTELEMAEFVCGMAAAGKTELEAFSAATKGPNGIKGMKREVFGQKYTQLLASPLLRKLEVRTARVAQFKSRVAEAVMLLDPDEVTAENVAGLLTQARENPRRLPALFVALTPLMAADTLRLLKGLADELYPVTREERGYAAGHSDGQAVADGG